MCRSVSPKFLIKWCREPTVFTSVLWLTACMHGRIFDTQFDPKNLVLICQIPRKILYWPLKASTLNKTTCFMLLLMILLLLMLRFTKNTQTSVPASSNPTHWNTAGALVAKSNLLEVCRVFQQTSLDRRVSVPISSRSCLYVPWQCV